MTTLHVTYRKEIETLQEEGRETLKRAMYGEPYTPLISVNFHDPSDVARVVSETYLELLTVIVKRTPLSIGELANAVNRDYESVSHDLSDLKAVGIVEFDDTTTSTRPILRGGADELEINISIHSGDS